jgi:hypothetical protein
MLQLLTPPRVGETPLAMSDQPPPSTYTTAAVAPVHDYLRFDAKAFEKRQTGRLSRTWTRVFEIPKHWKCLMFLHRDR